jgi:hypothetical protein
MRIFGVRLAAEVRRVHPISCVKLAVETDRFAVKGDEDSAAWMSGKGPRSGRRPRLQGGERKDRGIGVKRGGEDARSRVRNKRGAGAVSGLGAGSTERRRGGAALHIDLGAM